VWSPGADMSRPNRIPVRKLTTSSVIALVGEDKLRKELLGNTYQLLNINTNKYTPTHSIFIFSTNMNPVKWLISNHKKFLLTIIEILVAASGEDVEPLNKALIEYGGGVWPDYDDQVDYGDVYTSIEDATEAPEGIVSITWKIIKQMECDHLGIILTNVLDTNDYYYIYQFREGEIIGDILDSAGNLLIGDL
jgi:hypothetical protein